MNPFTSKTVSMKLNQITNTSERRPGPVVLMRSFPFRAGALSQRRLPARFRHGSGVVAAPVYFLTVASIMGEIRFSIMIVSGGIDGVTVDVCESMKDRWLYILCVNDTKQKGIVMGPSNMDPCTFIGLALTRTNEDTEVLASVYQKSLYNGPTHVAAAVEVACFADEEDATEFRFTFVFIAVATHGLN
ncbi:hypothetical protein EVAR_6751_1 [Eumeta japonica]|uniref:Uncharacterized protein n=1 Tax=Eumeta variegata TaxID=151549 RepID=A0A4C1V3L0_EUMVA|nr:hypothetical protein EVAR_6751_1 [Eumeta japonica]